MLMVAVVLPGSGLDAADATSAVAAKVVVAPQKAASEAVKPGPDTAPPSADPLRSADPVKIAARAAVAPPSGPATAMAARLAGDGQRTRLVIDLSRTVEFRAFTLANPYRVIIDLTDVTFALKADAGEMRRGLVSAYRFGVFAPGKARIVLDAGEPVLIDKAFVIEAQDDQPARLVVDLVKTDAAGFGRALPTPVEPAGPPAVAAEPATPGDKRPVIVLDPGHGGIDSGTTGASAFAEKAIVLDVALALREKLERSGRFRVVMTRSTDTFVTLGDRVRLARSSHAALFVSIHADALAAGDGRAQGASVYTLSDTASDSDAAHLAEKENKADLIAGVDLTEENSQVADILYDLAQRETKTFSALFARTLVGSMKTAARLHKSPIKSAGFRVLKAHDVPSVLVELGYMSSPQDLKQMTSDAWRDKLTDAMLTAVNDFFTTRVAGAVPGAVPPK